MQQMECTTQHKWISGECQCEKNLDEKENHRNKEIMGTKHTRTLTDSKTKQIIWLGHVQRMADEHLSKRIL